MFDDHSVMESFFLYKQYKGIFLPMDRCNVSVLITQWDPRYELTYNKGGSGYLKDKRSDFGLLHNRWN